MREIKSRHVHLDFHTSEHIPGVGEKFDKKNFQEALIAGHVNNINVFAKCHHGYCYYPTEVGTMHPTMDPNFDLTGAMVEAAHEIGVDAPIYITVGWCALDAQEHPEWVCRDEDGSLQGLNYYLKAEADDIKPGCSWLNLCMNTGYGEHVYKHTEEICKRYDRVDGLWFDIVFSNLLIQDTVCFCDTCKAMAKERGYNPENKQDMLRLYKETRIDFSQRLRDCLLKYHPESTVFFNTGGAEITMPEMHGVSTHFELEDLPTTWGGYDKMPIRAKYFSRKGKPYLGMTGKFHTSWGEFGGFKTGDAMKYECSSLLTYGAKVSIGDQMHPSGKMDLETYRLIGEAYDYVEKIEDYCFNTEETTRLGVITSENPDINESVAKVLCDCHYDFDIVHDINELATRFDAIILPEDIILTEEEAEKINTFAANGNGVLVTGESGLNEDKTKCLLNMGATYQGRSGSDNDFVQLGEKLSKNAVTSPLLMYGQAVKYKVEEANVLAEIKEPYFNRTYGKYCSHQNTPNKLESASYPAAMEYNNMIYMAHDVFTMYKTHGAVFHRQYIKNALDRIYKKPVVTCHNLPSAGRIRLAKQSVDNHYVLHLLYGSPIQRGGVSVIDDLPPIYDVKIEVRVDEEVEKVYTVPDMKEIPFTIEDGVYTFTVPKVQCHQLVVLDYK